jgi:hypothetical protein
VFGWIIPRWRFSNLIVLSLTAVFWGFLDLVWLWLLSLYRLALRIRELLGYPNDSNLHLFSDSKTNRDSLSEKWIDLTTAIVFLHPISLVFILQ